MLIDVQTASFHEKTVTGDELGDTLDLKASGYYGLGSELYLCVHLSAVDKGNGNETYSVKWQDGTAISGGNVQSPADIAGTTITFSRDNATDFKWVVLSGTENINRYLAAACNFGGTSPSAKVTAWVTGIKPEKYVKYADGVTFAANT